MSLLFFLFYWLVIPAVGVYAVVRLWRNAGSAFARALVATASLIAVSALLWLAVGEKWMADRQVRELCAKDGGVRVYETAPRTPMLIDNAGRVAVPRKESASASDEYYLESQHHYYQKGNPTLLRSEYRVIRRADQKVMGRSVFYGRSGGDLPGPWHESTYTCPDPRRSPGLQSSIFKEMRNESDK